MSAVGSRRGRAGAGSSGADRSRSGHLDADWSAGQWLADLAGDESALAAALAAAIRPARPGLVVCGDRSAGRGTGALPAFLAHELGATQALGLVSVEVAGDALVAHRRLPAGRRETIRVVPPAVCSVEAAGIRLRCASLPAALAARRATVPVVSPAAPAAPAATVRLGVPRPYLPRTHVVPAAPVGAARERVLALSGALARHETATVIGPVSPAEAAAELLAYLARTGTTQAPASIATTAGPAARAPSHPASPAAVAAPDSATKAATRPARQPTTPDGES
jgi:electron transfer flavoprotein beta subunit